MAIDAKVDQSGVDHVGRVIDQWKQLEPQIDTFPLHMGARLLRVARRLEEAIEVSLRPLGLTFLDFDVINTVRREGGEQGVPPKQLARFALVTSGAMTARLDRIERAGLVNRRPDPDDRRAIRVTLTPEGQRLAGLGLRAVLESYETFLQGIPSTEQHRIGEALQHLLLAHDLPKGPRGGS